MNDIELHPINPDAHGRATRYEVIRHEDTRPQPYIIGADDAPMLPPQLVRSQSLVEGSWSDRATGFRRSTMIPAIVVGVLSAIAAGVFGSSFALWTLLAAFWGGFAGVWLIAYALHVFVSAEGSQFVETLFLWRFLAREQDHRHQRADANANAGQRPQPWWAIIILATAIGCLGLFALLIIGAVALEMMP